MATSTPARDLDFSVVVLLKIKAFNFCCCLEERIIRIIVQQSHSQNIFIQFILPEETSFMESIPKVEIDIPVLLAGKPLRVLVQF